MGADASEILLGRWLWVFVKGSKIAETAAAGADAKSVLLLVSGAARVAAAAVKAGVLAAAVVLSLLAVLGKTTGKAEGLGRAAPAAVSTWVALTGVAVANGAAAAAGGEVPAVGAAVAAVPVPAVEVAVAAVGEKLARAAGTGRFLLKEANDAAPAAAAAGACVTGVAILAAGTTGVLTRSTAAASVVTAGALAAAASAALAALTAATMPAAALALAASTAADPKPAASAVPPAGGFDTGWDTTAVAGRDEAAADALLACAVKGAVACACCSASASAVVEEVTGSCSGRVTDAE